MTEPEKPDRATGDLESVSSTPESQHYVLRLFVTGMTPRSLEAFRSIKLLCETRLSNTYELEVIDIYQNPSLARDEQIVAVPTLIKKLPLPMRRLIGNLANEKRVLIGLNLSPEI
jgi:circadian clock protein KaiB